MGISRPLSISRMETPDLKIETMTKTSLEEQEHLWEHTKRGESTTVTRWQMQGSAHSQRRSQEFPCTAKSILHLLPWGSVGHSSAEPQEQSARMGKVRQGKGSKKP